MENNRMLYNSNRWIEDINTVSDNLQELSFLEGKSMMVTGAAGLVCSAVMDILIQYNEIHENKIELYAAGRWISEMENRFAYFCNRAYFHFVEYDAASLSVPDLPHTDYIIHGASNASPEMIVREPVETMMSNINGLSILLKHAAECGTKRLLYISSSEVYGLKESLQPYTEQDYGYIDILKYRNSYSSAKRAAETLCTAFAEEYGTETVIVRPGHIYGPTASPFDNRVSSSFAYAAAKGEDLILKSEGSQIRSYCYCLDCASAILKVLVHGKAQEAYNISNKESVISIRKMAETLAEAGHVAVRFEAPSDYERAGFNPMNNSSLNSNKLEDLGWRGIFNAETGLRHTVEILKEIADRETV